MSTAIQWKSHLIDFFFVTIGVFLAFGLNSWNEKRQEKQQTDLYLDGIKTELIENKVELDQALAYHAELLNTLETDPLNANLVLNPAHVNNVAWKLAEGDIFRYHVDPTIFKALSKTYKMHDGLETYTMDALKNINHRNVFSPYYSLAAAGYDFSEKEEQDFQAATKKGWAPIFETWIGIEKTYIRNIDEALKLL